MGIEEPKKENCALLDKSFNRTVPVRWEASSNSFHMGYRLRGQESNALHDWSKQAFFEAWYLASPGTILLEFDI